MPYQRLENGHFEPAGQAASNVCFTASVAGSRPAAFGQELPKLTNWNAGKRTLRPSALGSERASQRRPLSGHPLLLEGA